MYSGRVDVDNINPAKIMKLITASDLYQVTINAEKNFVNKEFLGFVHMPNEKEAFLAVR